MVEVDVTPLSAHLDDVIEQGVTVTAQESNRRFTFEIKDAGLYEIRIRAVDEDGEVVLEAIDHAVFSYSEEYNTFTSRTPIGEELMALIAKDGRGEVIEDAATVFASYENTITIVYDPRLIMLILAIALVLIDIAVRKFKFKWPHELIREFIARRAEKKEN